MPVKIIGDLLGHRSAESTEVYLRLATDDLRAVSIDLPAERRSMTDWPDKDGALILEFVNQLKLFRFAGSYRAYRSCCNDSKAL